jgi:hypothetical protein
VLPVLAYPAPGVPSAYPPCGSLRGEPCRTDVGGGEATGAHATVRRHHGDVDVHFKGAKVRAGDTLAGYRVVVEGSDTAIALTPKQRRATFSGLPDGTYDFVVIAEYASGATVASTPSNTVTVPRARSHQIRRF